MCVQIPLLKNQTQRLWICEIVHRLSVKYIGEEIFNQAGHLEEDGGYLVCLKLKWNKMFVIIGANGGGLSEIAITSEARTWRNRDRYCLFKDDKAIIKNG